MINPGNTNKQVTLAMKKVADAYGVKCIAGVEMYQMKRYVIDGNKKVGLREEPDLKVDACTFEQYEAYAVDVEMTTGEGRPVEKDARTTVFKRVVGTKQNLKVKASRMLFNEVNSRYPTLPFTLRCMADEKNARMGISECVTKQLLQPYPVYYEKQNDLVAQFKFTILLMGGGTSKITGLPVSPQFVSDKVLPDDIKEILESEMKKKKSRGGKKK
jgi:curved DNA binding protein